MISSNGFNRRFYSISYENKPFIWIYGLGRNESLYYIRNMRDTNRINPLSITKNFSQILFKNNKASCLPFFSNQALHFWQFKVCHASTRKSTCNNRRVSLNGSQFPEIQLRTYKTLLYHNLFKKNENHNPPNKHVISKKF